MRGITFKETITIHSGDMGCVSGGGYVRVAKYAEALEIILALQATLKQVREDVKDIAFAKSWIINNKPDELITSAFKALAKITAAIGG